MNEDNYSFFDERDEARNKASKDRVAAGEKKRAERQAQRDIRRAERSQLSSASSTSERIDIKERFEKIQEGVESGGIYDVSTDTYTPPEGNTAGANSNMTETGIQSIPRNNVTPNGDAETFDVVQSDNTAGTRTFFVL
tara:strand:+ start:1533 stop:1946 length:414 start_codon:yes stop_codon:yes gene_type:complete